MTTTALTLPGQSGLSFRLYPPALAKDKTLAIVCGGPNVHLLIGTLSELGPIPIDLVRRTKAQENTERGWLPNTPQSNLPAGSEAAVWVPLASL